MLLFPEIAFWKRNVVLHIHKAQSELSVHTVMVVSVMSKSFKFDFRNGLVVIKNRSIMNEAINLD